MRKQSHSRSLSSTLINSSSVTMSSLEIAELTGKSHPDVLRDIRKMLNTLGGLSKIAESSYVNKQNKLQPCFHLDQEHTNCLLTGYSAVMRMKVIKRWYELEAQVATPIPAIPQTYAAALLEAARLALENDQMALANKDLATKVESMENLFKKGMTPTQFCKMLNGVNTQQVNRWLAEIGWLYNESDTKPRWRVSSRARDKYLTEEQKEIIHHGRDGLIKYTPVLLHKGAVRIYQLYLEGKLPMKQTWDGKFTHEKELKGGVFKSAVVVFSRTSST